MKGRGAVSAGSTALWASAFVLIALILVQAGRLPGGSVAHAGNVQQVGELTILTAETGAEQDAIYVLDSVNGLLLVYDVQNRASIDLVQSYSVPRLFTDARAAAGLRPSTP